MISPGLMTLLRNTVAEEKRYPGNLASILCRQMSGRHLAVYKWKKRLHCGPARPRHVSGSMVMADRPDCLFQWVLKHPGGNIDEMWKDCLPADIDDEARHTWYHDLHWLINEGLLLLLSDGTLHAAKEQEKKPAAKKAAKKAAKNTAKKVADKTTKEVDKPAAGQEEGAEVSEDSLPAAKAAKKAVKKSAKKAARKVASKEDKTAAPETVQEPSSVAAAPPDDPPVDSPDGSADTASTEKD